MTTHADKYRSHPSDYEMAPPIDASTGGKLPLTSSVALLEVYGGLMFQAESVTAENTLFVWYAARNQSQLFGD